MIKISNRLTTIANLVLKEKTNGVIDVGCDHALLDIYLLQNNNNIKIIASDINKLPLESAKKNIEKYSFLNKIVLKEKDGLLGIENDIDTVVISGMGEETITKILKRDKSYLKNVNRLIISSNTNNYKVRRDIIELGYLIKDEKVVFEEGKYYVIIEFTKGFKKYTNKELYIGPILKNDLNLSYNYYKYLFDKKSEIIKKIPDGNKEKEKLKKEIKLLEETLLLK
ncbi:MAG: SAM-dependent methyltransferase [Bacilli bacterium]|nr:SAM-dependent methyltransferase [Bacilli bacterium]